MKREVKRKKGRSRGGSTHSDPEKGNLDQKKNSDYSKGGTARGKVYRLREFSHAQKKQRGKGGRAHDDFERPRK